MPRLQIANVLVENPLGHACQDYALLVDKAYVRKQLAYYYLDKPKGLKAPNPS